MEKQINHIDFEQVYVDYYSKLKRFAKEYVVSEADAKNVVHDVFLELWEKKDILDTLRPAHQCFESGRVHTEPGVW